MCYVNKIFKEQAPVLSGVLYLGLACRAHKSNGSIANMSSSENMKFYLLRKSRGKYNLIRSFPKMCDWETILAERVEDNVPFSIYANIRQILL